MMSHINSWSPLAAMAGLTPPPHSEWTIDPYEKYDMVFNGAAPARVLTTPPGNIQARTTAGPCHLSIRSCSR